MLPLFALTPSQKQAAVQHCQLVLTLCFRLPFLSMCCVVHYRTSAKGVDIDVLLALDYITSMQYFRLFRWDHENSANRTMQLLTDAKSREELWQSEQAIDEFLGGLEKVAEDVQIGLYKAVCAMLKSPIRAAIDEGQSSTTKHWLFSAYDDLKDMHQLPEWPQESKRQDVTEWSSFEKGALKVWLDWQRTTWQACTAVRMTGSSLRLTALSRACYRLVSALTQRPIKASQASQV